MSWLYITAWTQSILEKTLRKEYREQKTAEGQSITRSILQSRKTGGKSIVFTYTHAQCVASADAGATDWLVTLASLSESDASANILMPVWCTLGAQHSWTCQACMDGGRHHLHSHSHTAARTSASALSPTFPAEHHSTSTVKYHITTTKQTKAV